MIAFAPKPEDGGLVDKEHRLLLALQGFADTMDRQCSEQDAFDQKAGALLEAFEGSIKIIPAKTEEELRARCANILETLKPIQVVLKDSACPLPVSNRVEILAKMQAFINACQMELGIKPDRELQ